MNADDAVAALAALAQESRLKVFRLLVRQGAEGMAAGDIAAGLAVAPATLSFHLSQLSNAGLVESERRGRSIIYRIRADGVRGLLAYITEDCCGGRPELCLPSPAEEACCGTGACAPSCAPSTPRKGKRK